MIVTIDGVAASGKSSVSQRVAAELGVPYVSSGLLYRAATWLALHHGRPLDVEGPLLDLLNRHPVELRPLPGGNQVWIDGLEQTGALHTSDVDAGVSPVAQLGGVRAWVNAKLRALPEPFVAEGRDMGTAVFPGAGRKFYLTASPQVRAARRAMERPEDVDAIEAALIARDAHDARQSAPAPDATTIDTGDLNLEQVVARILDGVRA